MAAIGALLLMVALVSPALAQTSFADGAALAARAADAAKELRTHLAELAKAGGRPDFSKPPASELFGRIYDMNALAALPPPAPNEFSWLLNWSAAGGGFVKAILTFGITPPVGPSDQGAIERNLVDYEDQQAVASSFLVRITAREMRVLSLFMAQLPEDQRTPIREEGFDTARAGATNTGLRLKDRQCPHAQRRDPRHGRRLDSKPVRQRPAGNHARDRHCAERS